ncbi:ABC transporter substrate-binding protein [Variovorax sp. J22P240]|uniref:ABC transporter substrate-binding protein n=1 Tax=Variovorax sp. J22P240 TaxID=3053514 RepID=UPI002577BF77|nr:ABC transporter substrate-binding protein [Variovorax sp. J22P240]MDL9999368.1 ABC transporter substrate-binding protein [Variovorax sp. J22P240]
MISRSLDAGGRLKRRTACAALLPLLTLPWRSLAQVLGRQARVGLLIEPALDTGMQRAVVEPFRQGLRQLGYIEGQNIVLQVRSADGKFERLPELANELLRLELDVLVAAFPAATYAAKNATRTLPVVAASIENPIVMGLAVTMARPGGNITGISAYGQEVVAKRVQLVHEFVPTVRRIGILANPNAGPFTGLDREIAKWERTLGVQISVYEARGPDDFEGAFAAMAREQVGGLVVFADSNTYTHRVRLNELCLQRRMPSVWGGRDFLTGGGLASYQSDFPAMFRRAASLVDKILKGDKPAEMPFEQATKLELVIDKRAAKALGITVSKARLMSADVVLE